MTCCITARVSPTEVYTLAGYPGRAADVEPALRQRMDETGWLVLAMPGHEGFGAALPAPLVASLAVEDEP